MRRIDACVAIVGIAAVIFSTAPSDALSVRVGPYRFTFPTYWRWHRHHRNYGRPTLANPVPLGSTHGAASALFYPPLALSVIYANIFSPWDGSFRPFDDQAILSMAFAKGQPLANPLSCHRPPDLGAGTIAPIRTALAPTDAQSTLLEALGGALGAAADSLEKSCAIEIPWQPIPRLQRIGSGIRELATATNTIRNPLQDFARSLDDEQRARFAAMIADSASENNASHCGVTSSIVDRLIGEIDKSVQPTGSQRDALADLKGAIEAAASELPPLCLTPVPPTALSRLDEMVARLDATWHAVSSIQAALANFEDKLTDEQKVHFNAMNLVARKGKS